MSKKKSQSLTVQDEFTEFLLYTAPGGGVKVEVILNNETIWLTQQRMADLFGVDRTSISRHLKNIFESRELDENMVCAEIAHTTQHGAIPGKTQTQPVKYYNLDAVISVGYRINSAQATQFRIWATQMLKEYIIKGFVDSVNKFLEFNEYQVLEGYGKVTRKQAEEKAFAEYEKFNKQQKIDSDFDKQIKALEKQHKKQISAKGEDE